LKPPGRWPGLHNTLAVYIRDQLQPLQRPKYVATIEERVFVEGPQREIIPDVLVRQAARRPTARTPVIDADEPVIVRVADLEIHETYVEIRDRETGEIVVTVIELTSPWNKFPGPGRELYKKKQQEILASQSHLVEIDLLRGGQHVLAVPEWETIPYRPYD
jgi:hypothetical protein